MKREEILKQVTTPFGAPAFARGPRMFYNREYLNITYRTDADRLRKLVPEPLEIDDPLVRFEVMNMPDTMTHGASVECGQAIAVRFGQEHGEYLHAMYVNNHPAIASGREVNAYPKKLGSPNFYVNSDTLVGTLDYGTLKVAVATMGYKYVALVHLCPLIGLKSEIRNPKSEMDTVAISCSSHRSASAGWRSQACWQIGHLPRKPHQRPRTRM